MKHVPCRHGGLAAAMALALALPAALDARAADAPAPGDGLIVRFRDAASATSATSTVNAALTRAGVARRRGAAPAAHVRRLGNGADLLRLPEVLDDAVLQRVADELAADPRVAYAVPDRRRYPEQAAHLRPDDPQYPSHQWHLHDPAGGVRAPAAWGLSRGEGVVVAVLDTGILPDHPDFGGTRLLPGYDFVTEPFFSRRPSRGRVPGALDQGDWTVAPGECYFGSSVSASSWHGTHVAGTVAEATDNAVGMAGLANQATVLPVRVLGHCGGMDSDIIDALTWASGGAVPGVPANEHPADVINMSLGGAGTCPRPYQEAIDAAVARGTVIVVAAGNQGVDAATRSPAGCRNVVTVGATGVTGAIAGYSNYGERVDLSAPGGGGAGDGQIRGFVWQTGYSGLTTPTSGGYIYKASQGTSMASPHVAATVALVQSARVAAGRLPLAPSRMTWLLKASARPFPLSPPARKPIGAGIVDAEGAVRLAVDPACDVGTADCAVPPPTLASRVPASGQSGDMAGRHYRFEVEAGRQVSFLTFGGTGNVSLYVRHGGQASATTFDARSTRPGNNETVRIAQPRAGVYDVYLAGQPDFAGVTVMASQ